MDRIKVGASAKRVVFVRRIFKENNGKSFVIFQTIRQSANQSKGTIVVDPGQIKAVFTSFCFYFTGKINHSDESDMEIFPLKKITVMDDIVLN